ncbi:MAG: hypothetical protein VB085_10455 [Peptococcaceae bacterium]|nr:hypothetical protein [Peptococcaceae bacterium]
MGKHSALAAGKHSALAAGKFNALPALTINDWKLRELRFSPPPALQLFYPPGVAGAM